MNILTLSKAFGFPIPKEKNGIAAYNLLRDYFIQQSHQNDNNKFQSPSITPTSVIQRSRHQNEKEYNVYQRSDFTPFSLEESFNTLYKPLGRKIPKTLLFNSGMAAISTVMFFLKNSKKLGKTYIGENAYFETKWLVEDYRDIAFFNEYDPKISEDGRIFWLEYPINCTQPSKYPFNKIVNLKNIINKIKNLCYKMKNEKFALVIDYTLYYLPFNITSYLLDLPDNLHVYLITSLQKHRGYGLDLTNGGAITFYGDKEEYEYLSRLRSIMGTSITQENIWTMPPIKANVINKLISDSGNNAQSIYKAVSNEEYGPISFYFSQNSVFLTSFIFVEIGKSLMDKSSNKPYLSEILINEIIRAAHKNNAIIVHGTSFGLPLTRIFKNSERYENTNSLRIAVGYDSKMNRNVDKAISQGIKSFLKKVL